MGSVVTIISGNATQLVDEQKKVAASADEITRNYKAVDKELQQLDRSAKRTHRDTRTDLEKYNAKLAELSKLLQQNKIDQDTYNRAVKQAQVELDGVKESFGSMAVSAVAGMASLATVIGGIKQALSEVREEANRIGEQADARFSTRGVLAQVADPKNLAADFANLVSQSEDMLRKGAVGSIEEADRLTFALRSTGQESDRDTFAALGRTGLVESLSEVVNATDSLKDAFGRSEVGDVRQMLSKGLAASAVSQTSMEAILVNSAKAGAAAAKAGVTDEEMMAAVATLSDPLGGRAETAADRMRALFDAAQRVGIKADSLDEMLDKMARKSRGAGGSLQALGASEAAQAFDLLMANRDTLRQAIANVQAGGGGSQLDDMFRVLESDPQHRTAISRRSAASSLQAAELTSGIGQQEQLRDAIQDKLSEVQMMSRAGPVERAISRGSEQFWRFFGAQTAVSEGTLNRWRDTAQNNGNADVVRAINELIQLQREMVSLSKQNDQRRQSRKPVPVPES